MDSDDDCLGGFVEIDDKLSYIVYDDKVLNAGYAKTIRFLRCMMISRLISMIRVLDVDTGPKPT